MTCFNCVTQRVVEPHLCIGHQFPKDVIDLVLEPSAEHFVSLIQHKDLNVRRSYKGRSRNKSYMFSAFKVLPFFPPPTCSTELVLSVTANCSFDCSLYSEIVIYDHVSGTLQCRKLKPTKRWQQHQHSPSLQSQLTRMGFIITASCSGRGLKSSECEILLVYFTSALSDEQSSRQVCCN